MPHPSSPREELADITRRLRLAVEIQGILREGRGLPAASALGRLRGGSPAVGVAVAVASQMLIFPLFDINVPLADNLLIGLYFTIISIARSYTVRRFYILIGRG